MTCLKRGSLLVHGCSLAIELHKLLTEVPMLHIVNRDVMQLVVTELKQLKDNDNSYFYLTECAKIIACAAHSEAWLSPTAAWSQTFQRGPLQGDGYHIAYEREQMSPSWAEQGLADAFGGVDAFLFRSVEALLHDLIAVMSRKRSVLQQSSGSKVVMASPLLSEPIRCALEANVSVFPHQFDLQWSTNCTDGPLACFLHEDDFSDLATF